MAAAAVLGALVPGGPAWAQLIPVALTVQPESVAAGTGTVDLRVVASVEAPVSGGTVWIGRIAVNAANAQDLEIVGHFRAPDRAAVAIGPPTLRIGDTETEDEIFLRVRVPFGERGEGPETIRLSAVVESNPRYERNLGAVITIPVTPPTPDEERVSRKLVRMAVFDNARGGRRLVWPAADAAVSSTDFTLDGRTFSLKRMAVFDDGHGAATETVIVFNEAPVLPDRTFLRFVSGPARTTVDLALRDAYVDTADGNRPRFQWGPDPAHNRDPEQGEKAYFGALPNLVAGEWFAMELVYMPPDIWPPRIDRVAITDPRDGGGWFGRGDTVTVTLTFDEPVTVTTDAAVTHVGLTVGAVVRRATLTSTGLSDVHTFEYTVAAEADLDGLSIAANSFAGAVQDALGNAVANPAHAAVAADAGQRVDGAPPTRVGNVAFSWPPTRADTFDPQAPDVIQLTVTLSEAVSVVGAVPEGGFYIPFQVGAAERRAHYDAAATARAPGQVALVFSYTLVATDHAPHGLALAADDDIVLPADVRIVDRRGNALAAAALDLAEIMPDSTRKVGDVGASFGSAAIGDQQWHRDRHVAFELPRVETGNAPISYSLTGALPRGLTFYPDAVLGATDTTYWGNYPAILGTPMAEFASGTSFAYEAVDIDGDRATALTFTVGVATLPPANLRVIPGRYRFRLEWDAPDIVDAANVTVRGYRIERYTSDGGGFPAVPLVADTMSSGTVFVDAGFAGADVDRGVTATYRVSAISDGGVSRPSDPVTTPPVTDVAVPAAVADLTARATGPQTVALRWTAPDTNGVSITGYLVQRATVVAPVESADWTTIAPTFEHTGDEWVATDRGNALRAATTYHYRMAAQSDYGPAPYADAVRVETAAVGMALAPT